MSEDRLTKMLNNKTAKMRVDAQLLLNALHLPEDTCIAAAGMNYEDPIHPTIDFVVIQSDIITDEINREVSPRFITNYDKKGRVTKIEFVGWN